MRIDDIMATIRSKEMAIGLSGITPLPGDPDPDGIRVDIDWNGQPFILYAGPFSLLTPQQAEGSIEHFLAQYAILSLAPLGDPGCAVSIEELSDERLDIGVETAVLAHWYYRATALHEKVYGPKNLNSWLDWHLANVVTRQYADLGNAADEDDLVTRLFYLCAEKVRSDAAGITTNFPGCIAELAAPLRDAHAAIGEAFLPEASLGRLLLYLGTYAVATLDPAATHRNGFLTMNGHEGLCDLFEQLDLFTPTELRLARSVERILDNGYLLADFHGIQ